MSRITNLGDQLLSDEPALISSLDFGACVAQGTGTGPSLLIGDMSQISLMQPAGASFLDYRMAHLANAGDLVLVARRDPSFEAYLKDARGLNDITFLTAGTPNGNAVTANAITDDQVQKTLVAAARQHGGLTIKSYLTTGTTWHLAREIGQAAGCKIHVSGPSSRLSKRANDKLWFTRLARGVIGTDAVPPTMSAFGPGAAAAIALRYGKSGQDVIVKVPDSAGSTGNIRLQSELFAHQTQERLKDLIMDRLHATGWADHYPILVGVWDKDVTNSPSVQLWIPLAKDGPPVALEVFEQKVLGQTGLFVGAVRSTLPHALQQELATQAIGIAALLQRLGYYGSCSLDSVICRQDDGKNHVHWIECNGRWTAVSIPLKTLNTITSDSPPDGMVVVQQSLQGPAIDAAQAARALDGVLYRRRPGAAQPEGVILLSPPNGARDLVANLLVFAGSQADADKLTATALQRLRNRPTN
ncbi:hypothetical protein [Boseongicola aestuarii]|uniref:Pre ATP-grasp domain-containing protein n=1 Tax=Boseongicola aestuarii TaxID=1470561 RepID=A0A238J6G9_9RHOB|nr:hypothetical protein [Boseongicola aestuarii]SMX25550.1 hypothetical protein BOA8489_03694 [Boseongicola aestuarii]